MNQTVKCWDGGADRWHCAPFFHPLNSTVPVPVSGGHQFAALDASGVHACALDTAGRAWCWVRACVLA